MCVNGKVEHGRPRRQIMDEALSSERSTEPVGRNLSFVVVAEQSDLGCTARALLQEGLTALNHCNEQAHSKALKKIFLLAEFKSSKYQRKA